MAYKYSKGERKFDDITSENDAEGDTKINFEEDYIALETANSPVLAVSGSTVGIGTSTPSATEILTLSHTNPTILFRQGATDVATIGINASNNILLQNDNLNSHIVLKVKDGATTKEGLRVSAISNIDGNDDPEVVINEGQDSLLNFRVESANNTHMVYVDGANDRVGIGTDTPDYNLHVANPSAASVILVDGATNADAFLRFGQAGTLKSYIKQGSGGNLVITNETSDKDIILNIKDNTTEREGLRLNGDVAEVVVNEGNSSLVDFRVESVNNTHMLFVDGSAEKVGINTSTPNSGLHVNTSVTFAGKAITQDYTVTEDDHMIFVNANGGNITVTLPTAVGIIGRQYIIKRVDSSVNAVTIDPNASETIEGDTTRALTDQNSVVIVSDNNNWWITSEYISPPP